MLLFSCALRQALTVVIIASGLCGLSELAWANRAHVVSSGETLWKISRNYGCEIQRIRARNALEGSDLRVGQTLEIPPCETRVAVAVDTSGEAPEQGDAPTAAEGRAPQDSVRGYTIARGDTLNSIARRFDTSVDALMRANRLDSTRIYPGQTLEVGPGAAPEPRFVLGQSIGTTNRGRLRQPTRLESDVDYFIRRPHRAYGATHTVDQVRLAIAAVKRKFPEVHRLAVGDLSAKSGGKITRHSSHQNGRDVDLGFYFKEKPANYPQSFVVATRKNLHFRASWELIKSFAERAGEEGGVEKIFMSYRTQRLFYKLARKQGVPKETLERYFQYPRGRYSPEGIIRHVPGHNEHIHVRFQCPPGDTRCH